MIKKALVERCYTGQSPKEWWGNSENAEVWLNLNKMRERTGEPKFNTTIQSLDIVVKEIEDHINEFDSVLEIGVGDGRLIGAISQRNKEKDYYSVDINPRLSSYVKRKYPKINVFTADVVKLPFADNEIDLVFTYQVLQHIPSTDIERALAEIRRVAKKEVWLWEGRGKTDGYKHGDMTSKSCGGSFVWFFEKMIECYSVSIPKNDNCILKGQRFYKIKK